MKKRVENLAIFSGKPVFSEKQFVGRPNIGDRRRLLERFEAMLDRKWLTNDGPFVQELESRLRSFLGVRHCFAVCNGTIGLEIAIRGLNLTGEVILPSFTFIATAHALQWQAIKPVFCDIDCETHNIDPTEVEKLITPQTSGIIGVHIWGRPCPVEELGAIAARHGLKLLFDAAHAFGCSHQNRWVGNLGYTEVFSFHATKFFNSFEGGAIATNDDALANRIRLMRNFGFTDYDTVEFIGTNGKMHEATAAMALTSLDSLDWFLHVNRRNYERYRRNLSGIPGLKLVHYNQSEENNYQYIVLEIDPAETLINRNDIQRILWAENIIARRYFYPGCHRMEPYRSSLPQETCRLSQTETLTDRVLCLPTGTAFTEDGIDRVSEIISLSLANPQNVLRQLNSLDAPS